MNKDERKEFHSYDLGLTPESSIYIYYIRLVQLEVQLD